MANKVTPLFSTALEREHFERERTLKLRIRYWRSATFGLLFAWGVLGAILFTKPATKLGGCPQVVNELASSERLQELYLGWYHEERQRTAEYRSVAEELLLELGRRDKLPPLPPERAAAP